MKLRDKLKISFCVMIILPVIMLCVFVVGIFKMQSDRITLEQSFERLEEIIAQMEKSDTTLDASFKMYQEGMKLVESCNNQLDKVEKQIIVLNDDGEQDDE